MAKPQYSADSAHFTPPSLTLMKKGSDLTVPGHRPYVPDLGQMSERRFGGPTARS